MADEGGEWAGALAGRGLFSEALGRAVCARVAAGESLSAIGREPGMPERSTVRGWARADPVFGEALAGAMRSARLAARAADRARLAARPKPWTPGRPCGYTPAKGEAICRRLVNGESLVAIGRDPGGPSSATILYWVKHHPEFEEAYTQARLLQADFLFDEAREVGLAATPKTVSADRLRFDIIRWQTARLAPRKYCERLVVTRDGKDADEGQGLTVIVKRFSDVTADDEREADETEARAEGRPRRD